MMYLPLIFFFLCIIFNLANAGTTSGLSSLSNADWMTDFSSLLPKSHILSFFIGSSISKKPVIDYTELDKKLKNINNLQPYQKVDALKEFVKKLKDSLAGCEELECEEEMTNPIKDGIKYISGEITITKAKIALDKVEIMIEDVQRPLNGERISLINERLLTVRDMCKGLENTEHIFRDISFLHNMIKLEVEHRFIGDIINDFNKY